MTQMGEMIEQIWIGGNQRSSRGQQARHEDLDPDPQITILARGL
jgi:hypothetical protein